MAKGLSRFFLCELQLFGFRKKRCGGFRVRGGKGRIEQSSGRNHGEGVVLNP